MPLGQGQQSKQMVPFLQTLQFHLSGNLSSSHYGIQGIMTVSFKKLKKTRSRRFAICSIKSVIFNEHFSSDECCIAMRKLILAK